MTRPLPATRPHRNPSTPVVHYLTESVTRACGSTRTGTDFTVHRAQVTCPPCIVAYEREAAHNRVTLRQALKAEAARQGYGPDDRIMALRCEAGRAGDLDMVKVCDRALAGDDGARDECAQVIDAAAAMDDVDRCDDCGGRLDTDAHDGGCCCYDRDAPALAADPAKRPGGRYA
jgi:hypothetical protein